MSDSETTQVLLAILEMLKQQAIYLHRQHGWMIAVAETLREKPELRERLEQQPFYDQGPRPDVRITDVMLRNIDVLIQRLKSLE